MRNINHRSLRHRLYVSALALLVCAIIVFMNLSGGLLENKFDLCADFSRSSVFTLSEDTQRLLAELERDVLLYAVYGNDAQDMTVEQMIKAYDRTSEHVHSRVLDPVDDVDLLLPFTRDGAAVNSGSIIVSDAAAENFHILDYYDFYLVGANGVTGIQGEQSISSAIAHLDGGTQRRTVFMNAHTDTGIAAVPAFATHLSASGYGLFQSEDAFSVDFGAMLNPQSDMLVFLSPTEDLEDAEVDALIDYVRRGGSVMAFMDYARSIDGGLGISLVYDQFTNFSRLFAEAGMQLEQTLVLMPEADAAQGSITRFNASAVNNGLMDGADGILCSEAAAIEILDSSAAQPLLMSPASAYGKRISRDMEGLDQNDSDPAGARCVAAYGRIGEGRVALAGTSSPAALYFGNEDNCVYFMKLVGALLNDADNPVILPVSTGSGTLKIATSGQQILLIAMVAGVLPLSVLAIGAIVIRHRKKQSGRAAHD